MPIKIGNRVFETTTTTGTGTLDLAGAQAGYRSFANEFANNDQVSYLVVDNPTVPTAYEYGYGTFLAGSPNRLQRDTVQGSSNSGAKVSWGSGTKYVLCTPTAQWFSDLSSLVSTRRNLIINGAMQIDQRKAGGAHNTAGYCLDRWQFQATGGGALQVTRMASATPPTGHSRYARVTVATADSSVATGDYYMLVQAIEGFQTAHLDWGKATATAVTLSFWVRSSIAGTYSGALTNNATNRSYAFTITVNASNTWEYKTVTVPGDTSGSWEVTTATGIALRFCLAAGATYLVSAGAWGAGNVIGATGSNTSWIGTLGATFDLGGVQLEEGSVATPFESRSISEELLLCQRYYEKSYGIEVVPGSSSTTSGAVMGLSNTAGAFYVPCPFKVPKRTVSPTVTIYSPASGLSGKYYDIGGTNDRDVGSGDIGDQSFVAYHSVAATASNFVRFHWTAANEL